MIDKNTAEKNRSPAESQQASESQAPEGPDRAPDFGCQATESFGRILGELNLTLMLTSYQANRLILVRSSGDDLHLSVKAFPRPMGLAVSQDRMVMGIHSQIIDFRRFDGVSKALEPQGLVKHCFTPRSSHFTGMVNVHDIAWGNDGLWAVNSNFSCLMQFQGSASFVPRWKPAFISELVPEDRCHLNGMAMKDGQPGYVTCFNDSDETKQWRFHVKNRGLLIDVQQNKILADDLYMPHSPRFYRGQLYFCNSARGQLCRYDFETQTVKTELELPGFTRGMAFYGDLLFIGLSEPRTSKNNNPPPVAEKEVECGVCIVDIRQMEILGSLTFTGDMTQIYDVALAALPFAEVLQPDESLVSQIFEFPPLKAQG
ncbi:hypothetical protein VA7868_03906 [Vibrio aerogenes CECT 7868]|uniref:Conserved hypothetical protein CHP03032 domain-containing protein n=1 Tax=Vibrio aerogenes CECT 7868 TaxID=1216006 RepID=A0A1M6BZU0_9VIBR|nr:TIGR03032 family protein [Vibrio aerogenes]SHI54131.1 hypothetical protein VA7868_03906 [Vibrio aerogenes CECT 7868]